MNWRAADYDTVAGRKQGRVHILRADGGESRCGKSTREMGGRSTTEAPSCRTCVVSQQAEIKRGQEREASRVAAEQWKADRKAERDAESAEWWARYNRYLATEKWRAKSAAVIRRAGGVCEACGVRPATEAHHLTYRHVGDEPLFDLRAVCHPCHEKITLMERFPSPPLEEYGGEG